MNKKFGIDIIIYFVGTVCTAVLSFVLSLIYSQIYETSEYGYYSLVYSLYHLVLQTLTGWVTHAILRFDNDDEIKHSHVRTSLLFVSCLLTSLVFVGLLIYYLCFDVEKTVAYMLIIFASSFWFETVIIIINTFLRFQQKSKAYSVNSIINSVLKISLILIGFYLMKIESITLLAGCYLITEIIQAIYLMIRNKFLRGVQFNQIDIQLIMNMIRYAVPLMGANVVFWILSYSDRYIINYFCGVKDVGLYSYGYQMGTNLFMSLTGAIMLAAYPSIVRGWKNNGKLGAEKEIKYYLTLYLYILIPAGVGIIIIGNDLIELMCGKNYWDSSEVFIIICLSYIANGLIQYINKAWELRKTTHITLILTLVTAIINIILNIILVPRYGYKVAAYTTLISFLIEVFLDWLLAKKYIRFSVDKASMSRVIIATVIMTIILYLWNDGMVMLRLLVGVIVYFLGLILMRDSYLMQLIDLIKKKIRQND